MAPVAVLTGKWATAEDTAEALGVSPRRLKQLKKLAAELLAPKHRSQRTGNGQRLSRQTKKSAAVAGSAKSTKRAKKNTQNAHNTSRAPKHPKSN
jgi:hypothetical protein